MWFGERIYRVVEENDIEVDIRRKGVYKMIWRNREGMRMG